MSITKSTGRPKLGEAREKQRWVSFLVDDETLAAIERLKKDLDVGVSVRSRRSIVLRRAVMESDQLHARKVAPGGSPKIR